MKTLAVALLMVVLAIAGLAAYVAIGLFNTNPVVVDNAPLTGADLLAVKSLLQQTSQRNQVPGTPRQLKLRGMELEQAVNYVLDRRATGNARITIDNDQMELAVSLLVPHLDFDSWLNIQVAVTTDSGQRPVLHHLKIGHFTMPDGLANRLLTAVETKVLVRIPDYARVQEAVDGIVIDKDHLIVNYRWQPALMSQLAARGRDLMLDSPHQQRLAAYAGELSRLTRNPAFPSKPSLTVLLAPMFAFAHQRGGDAVEENRAVLQLLALYVIDTDPARVLGQDAGIQASVRHELRLAGRHDFAEHFLISAAVEASSGNNLAALVGLLKEQQDFKAGGTGFSFNDLAFDRAGAKLGELASVNETTALALQQLLAPPDLQESLFTPPWQDLPEFMTEAEFATRFEAVGSPPYRAMTATIESRVTALPLVTQLQAQLP